MKNSVKNRLEILKKQDYRKQRAERTDDIVIRKDVSPARIRALTFFKNLSDEKPVFICNDDIFGFNRYRKNIHLPFGKFSGNFCPRYDELLNGGLLGIKEKILKYYDENTSESAREFYDIGLESIDKMEKFVANYREEAQKTGHEKLFHALKKVPMNGATDYYEALVSVHFLHYVLRLNADMHVGFGRFDKYMKPFYDASKNKGVTDEEILELTELFYISLNFDSDLYPGVQQGDNGQSLVLGGIDENGNDVFSDLSLICLKASEELKIIDPKINLRVCKNTPLSLYEIGTKLTKQGLGFPQYSNDDVVIPALLDWGYDYDDAVNYVVAACWEFIVHGGNDVPNICTMNFPKSVDIATKKYLQNCNDFDEFFRFVEQEIKAQIKKIVEVANKQKDFPDPLRSLFLDGCVESGKDLSESGAKYNNFGIHGAGISNAVDALVAIKKVFEEKPFTIKILLDALNADFVGFEDVRRTLLSYPKMGNNDDEADDIANSIMEIFTSNLNNVPNNRCGVFRAGTGSAMEYILQARRVPATADGRKAFEPFASSFSPSLTAKINGPLSAVQSFTKYDMKKIANGGPFTIEIHDTVFRNDEGEKKVAMLVKSFIDLGGHQIQINSINRDVLLDAQKHPENYRNLIVRVWGWSGYFVELAPEYQNHVIKRTEFSF